MKQGKDIVTLAKEIKRRSESKADFLVASSALKLTHAGMDISADEVIMPLRPLAHSQLAEYTGIPARYYAKMQEEGGNLLYENVNYWLARRPDDRRMVRTLDHHVRAFLSDRYRRLDNEDVAEAAFPVLLRNNDIQLVSADITETKLYLKAVFPKVEQEVGLGDVVQAGVVISNSEVGQGALSVEPLVYRLRCLNGMILPDSSFKKMHIGSRYQMDGISARIFRDETREADDRALLMAMQDMIAAASKDVFDALVNRMREASGTQPVQKPRPAVERLGKSVGLLVSEQDSVLENLIRDQDYSLYGMANAVTRLANTTEDYDRATELQMIGGRVLSLNRSEWRTIAEAA